MKDNSDMVDPAARSSEPPPQDGAGELYGELIQEQLQEERARKESLERRGFALVPTSGFLATLVFGLTTAATRSGGALSLTTKTIVAMTLLAFLFSALAGLLANWSREYEEPSLDELQRITQEKYWSGRESVGSRRVAEVRLASLRSARDVNDTKEKWLYAAMVSEIIGTVLIAVLVADLLF